MDRNNLVTILVGLACGSASATTAIQTAQDTSTSSSFTNAANWAIDGQPSGAVGAPLDPTVDYVNPGGKKNLCSPRWYDESSSSVFAGRSLTIGSSGGEALLAMYPFAAGAHLTFANEGLKLVNGTFCNWYGHNIDIYGKIQIDNCLDEKPIQMYSNAATTQLAFHGPVSSDEGKWLWLYSRDVPEGSAWSQKHFVARFVDGSLAGFRGRVSCYQYAPAYADVRGPNNIMTELVSDTDTIPGTIELGYNCRISAETAESVISVGTLEFRENSGFGVTYDKTTKKASLIKVADAFTHEGRIRVLFDAGYTLGTYPDSALVPELAVFKAPSGITLDVDDFVFDGTLFPTFDMYVRTDTDGLSTLFIKQHGKVVTFLRNEVADDYNTNGNSFVSGTLWSDGQPPSLDKDYYVPGKIFRAHVKDATVPVVFPGHALAVSGGEMQFDHREVVFSNLYFIGTSQTKIYNYWATDQLISGRIHNYNTSEKGVTFFGYDNRPLRIGAPIEGPGNVTFCHCNATKGRVSVHAVNSNLTGKVSVTSDYTTPNDETASLRLTFDDPLSLGGPMAAWTYDGLAVSKLSKLIPSRSMTYETSNRGILIDGTTYLQCANDICFAINQRVTWKGSLTKREAGTLALGGPAPYFETDGGTTPQTDHNVLVIAEGNLKPLSAEAFTGLAVTLASGTGIAVDVPADTTDGVGKYGMLLTGAGSSLTVQGTEVPVSIDVPEGVVAKSQFVPICTVSTEAAGALRGKFVLAANVRVAFDGSVTIEERADTVADTVTFGAKLTRGMVLILR